MNSSYPSIIDKRETGQRNGEFSNTEGYKCSRELKTENVEVDDAGSKWRKWHRFVILGNKWDVVNASLSISRDIARFMFYDWINCENFWNFLKIFETFWKVFETLVSF